MDAFEDYALDLQARFDGVEPYRSMHGVERRALRLAVGNQDDALVNIGHFARMAITCCADSWCSHWKQLDPVYPDHYCRITRQRVAALCPADECKNTSSHSALPLPPSTLLRLNALERPHPARQRLQGRNLPLQLLVLPP